MRLVEAIEDVGAVLLGDAEPPIPHGQHDEVRRLCATTVMSTGPPSGEYRTALSISLAITCFETHRDQPTPCTRS